MRAPGAAAISARARCSPGRHIRQLMYGGFLPPGVGSGPAERPLALAGTSLSASAAESRKVPALAVVFCFQTR